MVIETELPNVLGAAAFARRIDYDYTVDGRSKKSCPMSSPKLREAFVEGARSANRAYECFSHLNQSDINWVIECLIACTADSQDASPYL